MTKKQIVLIIMCAMLLIMVVLMGVVAARLAPLVGALLFGPGAAQPSATQTDPSNPAALPTDPTVPVTQPSTEPTRPPVTDPGHEHSFVLAASQQATCEEPGWSKYVCSCGAEEMRDYVPALGHSYQGGRIVPPTCTEDGYTEYTCTVCGHVERRDIVEASGHQYELVKTQEASCTEDGYTEYKCAVCGDIKRENVQLATGHTFGEWIVDREPAPNDPGERHRVCETCHEAEKDTFELTIRKDVSVDSATGVHSYLISLRAVNSAGEMVDVYTYEVADMGGFGDMQFARSGENGLTVSFQTADGPVTYTLAPGDTLIIGKDGAPVQPSGGDTPAVDTEE